jgi:hypothetical protein
MSCADICICANIGGRMQVCDNQCHVLCQHIETFHMLILELAQLVQHVVATDQRSLYCCVQGASHENSPTTKPGVM